ncbi:hypothetical protein [Aquipuribacter hungaricus]|uniref:Uncharacterized protein n=1 Tax=Aquipuribacter hungaricus TaxID=545624 RepID=A0ABV7WCZ3_9MICO
MLLVVGLVVGLVALASRWTRAPEPVAQPVCRAEVPAPDDGGVLRAEFSPERTANAALVVGMADRRGLPARAATIGIATAIQESGLVNIDYGDRDSLGLFQQRPSQGWGTEEQVQDPVYATGAFYDALVEIDGYTELEITDAAQQVQRSGFPEAYADHEGEGRALASSLYGLSPATLVCELPPLERAGGEQPADAAAADMVSALQTWATEGWQASAVEAGAPAEGEEADPSSAATVVLDAAGAAEPGRTAWALAHSAVALAERHRVVRVEVDGRVWDRGEAEAGWSVVETGEGGAPAAGDGRVRVTTG